MSKITAKFWKKTAKGAVLCQLCARNCLIAENERGFCQVRIHEGGTLYSLNYGYPHAMNLDPVEKKPLYHYRPGTLTWSVGAPGCNFDCLGCQNYDLSRPRLPFKECTQDATPSLVVEQALSLGADSFSFTYSEPTVFFEYAQDVGRLAKENGLQSIWVSNGFFSKAALEALDYVAAMNIDLKGYSEDFYGKVACARLEPVKENIKRVWEKGIWLEVTTLIIPTVNDGAEELSALAAFIAEVSPDIPWHLSRFHPLRNQRHLSMTPESTLEKAREIGKSAGLKYVYLGNVRGADYADTFCPGCGAKLLQRDGFSVSTNLIGGSGVCPQCGEKIAGIW